MTMKTRYFVIVSLLVLTVGLGTGLLSYYAGFPTSASTRQGGPAELQFVPSGASLVAFADVREIMASALRQRIRTVFPEKEDGQREFANQTGINIETDIDRVTAAITPIHAADGKLSGLVLARGRFDVVKIEAFMRDHGGRVEDYKGKRLIVGDASQGSPSFSMAFVEPGLVAFGTSEVVRTAVDLAGGGPSVTTNDDIMNLVRDLDFGNAWAVGRFETLAARAILPSDVTKPLPAIRWFSASARVDAGVRGVFRADAGDENSAASLRDVIRGMMAVAKLQSSARPELETLLRSLELGGTGKTVALSFDLSPVLLEALGSLATSAKPPLHPAH
jgi:hypothetical protein